jgi:hypothetical protein
MDDEIADRIERLSPEARALFWELQRRGEESEFRVPPDELVVNLRQRMAGLPPQDLSELVDLYRAIKRRAREEGLKLEAEGLEAEGFMKLIARAKELDRRAGRPVNEAMTLEEAVPKLEAAGELGLLEREYLKSVRGELVWVPVDEDE